MKRRFISLFMIAAMLISVTAIAATNIGTNWGTMYFQYRTDAGSWEDLKTPQHWDTASGNVAYCLDHTKDSPPASANYSEFNPDSMMSATLQRGIKAILANGYPNNNGGLPDDQARYATANAIRAYLSENGMGYNFMTLSRGKVRAKSGYQAIYDFMEQLVQAGRSGTGGGSGSASITVTPPFQLWQTNGTNATATLHVTTVGTSQYNVTGLPSGVTMTGYTGNSGDTLTLTAPDSYAGTQLVLAFDAQGGSGEVSVYWYKPAGGSYQPVIVIDDTAFGGILRTTAVIGGAPEEEEPPPPPRYDLTVNKVDDEGNPLPGAQFTLSGTSGTQSFTAGSAEITELLGGGYTLTENGAPIGYIPSAVINITMNSDKTVTVVNKITVARVSKTDAYTHQTMPNVEFRVKNTSGGIMKLSQISAGVYKYNPSGSDTFLTDANGKVDIKGLPLGSYTFEEVAPPVGYAQASPQAGNVGTSNDSSSPSQIAVSNEPLTLELTKTDDFTKQLLDGAIFKLLDSAGDVVKLTKIANGEYKPDTSGSETFTTVSGKAFVRYLPVGSYKVVEVTPPIGFMPDSDKPFTMTVTNGMSSPVKVSMKDEPLTLELTKKDALTDTLLDGAVFMLLDEQDAVVKFAKTANGEYKADKNGADTFTTDKGKAILRYLPAGHYTVEEVTPPTGFMPDKPVKVEVKITNGTSNPAKAEMKDEPLTIEFTKLDSFTQQPMDGAKFRLTDENGTIIKLSPFDGKDGFYKVDSAGADTFTTKNGKAVIYYVPVGKYTIKETSAAIGFAKTPDKTVSVAITNGFSNPAKQSMQDEPLTLDVRKVDSLNGQPVGGAVFKLTDEDGKTIKLSPITGKVGYFKPDDKGSETFAIDSTGKAKILYLPFAVYKLLEVQAPVGYVLTAENVTVTVRSTNSLSDPAQIDVKNTPTKLIVEKLDATNNKYLDGGEFRMIGSDGKPVLLTKQNDGSYKANSTGSEIFAMTNGCAIITHVPIGKYSLEEVKAPDGYGIAKPITFTLTDANTINAPLKTGMADKPLMLKIRKVTRENKILTGAGFAIKAEGALNKALTFTKDDKGVYRYDPSVKETTIMVNEKGEAVIYGLPIGEYQLEETVVPKGYFPAPPQKIIIKSENDTDKPFEAVVVNDVTVKLGFDTDKWRLPMAIVLFVLALGGGVFVFLKLRQNRRGESDE